MADIADFTGEDLTGRKFGEWVVTGYSGPHPTTPTNIMWRCRCSCGIEKDVSGGNLKNGRSSSCGHWKKTHGMFGSPEYKAWCGMRTRCTPGHSYYERGIRICERWQSFANFYQDMGPKPTPRHSVDRIDNDKGYEPDNCRWATPKEQGRNKRTNRPIVYRGKSMCVSAFGEAMGIPPQRIFSKFVAGWTDEEVIEWAETHSDAISRSASEGLRSLESGDLDDVKRRLERILDLA